MNRAAVHRNRVWSMLLTLSALTLSALTVSVSGLTVPEPVPGLRVSAATLGGAASFARAGARAGQPDPAPAGPLAAAGCLIPEREYASARGLSISPASSRDTSQLVLVIESPDTASRGNAQRSSHVTSVYVLTGRREAELGSHVHSRVELSGTLDAIPGARPVSSPAAPPTPPASGNAGVTPDGSPAHEPGDAAVATRREASAGAVRDVIALDDLPRLNVTAVKTTGTACSMPQASSMTAAVSPSRAADAQPEPVSAPAATPVASLPQLTVTGCVLREDETDRQQARLVLRHASVRPVALGTAGAVPGSPPSGSGSGTINAVPVDQRSDPAESAYVLEGYEPSLTRELPRRVEITGRVLPASSAARTQPPAPGARAEAPASAVAHPSAPEQRLQVLSFRPVAGSCPR